MADTSPTPLRIVTLVAGTLLLLYALRCLQTGRIISTWGQYSHRPSVFYWVTLAAFLLVAALNLYIGVRSFFVR